MIRRFPHTFISKINTYPTLKKNILKIWDGGHYVLPFVVGFFTRRFPHFLHFLKSKVIAQPGTLGFKGGAFNPGAIELDENRILLIAKAQLVPWYLARGLHRKYYLDGHPTVFILDHTTLETQESYVIHDVEGFPNNEDFALEDFRAFYWKGQMMLNHSYVVKGQLDGYINQIAVRSALSVFDYNANKITFQAFPRLDFPTQNFEKNWVYKEHEGRLLLFYSLHPFKVLALENEGDFSFKTKVNINLEQLSNPGGFGTLVSYSTNPIDFDERHWLMVIHQIEHKFTGRCYYHWALLIDKATFLPVKITAQPIFSGMGARGRLPGIRYISSILKTEGEILFFAGEGDVYVTVTRKSINEINSLWVDV